MTRIKLFIAIAAALVVLPSAPMLAGQGYETLKGEVVAVQQQTQNQGADQVVTVRTRSGRQKQFHLGGGSGCEGCVRVGDRVQARLSKGGGNRSGQVQSMRVRRNGETYGYSNQSGQLVRTRQRLRDGSDGGKQVSRQSQNGGRNAGNGNCRSGGSGRGGGRGQGGGGGR